MAPGALLPAIVVADITRSVAARRPTSNLDAAEKARRQCARRARDEKQDKERVKAIDGHGVWRKCSKDGKEFTVLDASGGAAVSILGLSDPSDDQAIERARAQPRNYVPGADFHNDDHRKLRDFLIESTGEEMATASTWNSGKSCLSISYMTCSNLKQVQMQWKPVSRPLYSIAGSRVNQIERFSSPSRRLIMEQRFTLFPSATTKHGENTLSTTCLPWSNSCPPAMSIETNTQEKPP